VLHIRASEVSRDAISKYERDDIVPSVENAHKIAKVLGVSLDYLMSECRLPLFVGFPKNRIDNVIRKLSNLFVFIPPKMWISKCFVVYS